MKQLLEYELWPSYFDMCLRFGHKCRDKKIEKKWQPKQPEKKEIGHKSNPGNTTLVQPITNVNSCGNVILKRNDEGEQEVWTAVTKKRKE